MQNGVDVAVAKAKDTLGADAVMVFAGTFGNLDLSAVVGLPVTLNFYQDSVPKQGFTPAKYPGQADGWGFVFYSPSKQQNVNLFVAQPIIGGMQAYGVPIPIPIPGGLVTELNTSAPGMGSDSLMMRVKRDTAYTRYHATYPKYQPSFVTLGDYVPAGLPDGFPLSGGIWSMTFTGHRDSTTGVQDTAGLVCFVSVASGQTLCQWMDASASVPVDDATVGHAALSVAPNPATGRTHITVNIPSGMSAAGAEMVLFNALGEQVLDLSESFARNGYSYAEFDASTLPAGRYFCRVTGTKWNGNIGVVIGN
jgi:hypothetical protein